MKKKLFPGSKAISVQNRYNALMDLGTLFRSNQSVNTDSVQPGVAEGGKEVEDK